MSPLNREILRLAIPSIFANITVPIVGMVDLAVAGHLDGDAAVLIGGVSIGTLLFDLLYWNFSFLRIGTGGLTAQAYGRGDMKAAADALFRSSGMALIIAAACILAQWVFVDLAFLVVKCSPEVRELAEGYFHVRIWAAPATLTLMAVKGWFIGMQDSVRPMITDLIVNLGNAFISIVLAMGIHAGPVTFQGIGFDGIAAGTLIAQYSGLLYALAVIFTRYRKVFTGYSASGVFRLFRDREMKSYFKLNADLLVRSMCIMAIYAGMTVISARYGDMMLAVSSILVQMMMLFSYFTDGFAYAGEALTGRFVGMERPDSVRKTVRCVFAWSMGVAALFMVIYAVLGEPVLHLLTSDGEVVAASLEFIPWLIPMPVIGCAAFTWDGIYVGATASRTIRDSSIWAVVAFFAAWYAGRALLSPTPDGTPEIAVHILMAAYMMHVIVRFVYETALYKRSILSEPFAR